MSYNDSLKAAKRAAIIRDEPFDREEFDSVVEILRDTFDKDAHELYLWITGQTGIPDEYLDDDDEDEDTCPSLAWYDLDED